MMDYKPSILVDNSEQVPWIFPGYKVFRTNLRDVGSDYSLRKYSKLIGVERKSFMDFVMRISSDNIQSFMRNQIAKLLKLKFSCIIIEGHPEQSRKYSSIIKIKPEQIISVSAHIMSFGLPVLFAGDRQLANYACLRFLLESKKRVDEI